jgi:hypothetical protein
MFDRILNKIRDKVRTLGYVMTLHAEEEMDDDGLTIFDIEHCLITGEITECQKDRETGERKYLVRGENLGGNETTVVTNLGIAGTLVIITVYIEGGLKNHGVQHLRKK